VQSTILQALSFLLTNIQPHKAPFNLSVHEHSSLTSLPFQSTVKNLVSIYLFLVNSVYKKTTFFLEKWFYQTPQKKGTHNFLNKIAERYMDMPFFLFLFASFSVKYGTKRHSSPFVV